MKSKNIRIYTFLKKHCRIYEDSIEVNQVCSVMELFAKQLLKLAAENARADIKTEYDGNTGSEYCYEYAEVDKQSIIDTIKKIK